MTDKRRARPFPRKKSWLSLVIASISLWLVLVGSIWLYTSGAVPRSPISWMAMLLLFPFAVWVSNRDLFGTAKDKTKLDD